MSRTPSLSTVRRIGARVAPGAIVLVLLLVGPGIGWPSVAAAPAPQEEERILTAARSGRYDEAIEAWEARLRAGTADAAQVRHLVDTLMLVGRYEDALEVARAWDEREGTGAELANRLGTALRLTGDWTGAEAAFERALAAGAADAVQARLNLAILEFDTGRRQAAMARFEDFIDLYNSGAARTAADLTAVAVACTYLGREDPQLFHDAVRAFDEAIAADPDDLEPRLRAGLLFLDKYDAGEAEGLIGQALAIDPRHPDVLLARARLLRFQGEPGVMEAVGEALEVNRRHVGALVFEARQLLLSERIDEAEERAGEALEVAPRSLEALSILAAARFIDDDREAFEELAERALAINPRYGELFDTVAELAVQNRLYEEAVVLARRAVEVDPGSWDAWGTLGINQLRIGEIDAGRESLEVAFAGDPFNVWFKNTLDLLDTFPGYETVPSEHFELFLEAERADLLSLYMGPLADEALETLAGRYGVMPETPVRVEVYGRHADFSVRTVGLAGIGALGVAFGPVIAVDAPSTPGVGEFNWGATLWHEIAHVVTLDATEHRVPRWLTEGLSVFEERRARPGWGDDVDPGFLLAHLQGKLLPVSRINDGFVRPSYPEQLSHSYLQASLVCELIAAEWGFEAILQMLDGYRRGLDTGEVFAEALGMAPDGLDERFEEFLEARYGPSIDALRPLASRVEGAGTEGPPSVAELRERAWSETGDYGVQLSAGRALVREGRLAEAEEFLERAVELFPQHAGPDGPYPLLARVYEATDRKTQAVEVLREMTRRNARHRASWEHLATLLEDLGRAAEAAGALEQVVWIDPTVPEIHRRVAALWERAGRWQEAIRPRRAIVALDPVDRAEALYLLARTQLRGGDPGAARRSVLRALEVAPSYAEAQELLLEIRSAGRQSR